MLLEEFRHIAETAVPQPINSRIVTPDEARAVLTSFGRLSDDKLRSNFLTMPVDNIIEFSLTQTKKRPTLYTYMNGHPITEAEQPATPASAIPVTELDHLDEPPEPQPVVERAKPKRKKPIEESKPHPAESYFTRLTERLEQLAMPTPAPAPSIVVETTERHVERLAEIEQAMLGAMDMLVERIGSYATETANKNDDLRETLAMQRAMIQQISESQASISAVQAKLVETQSQIVDTVAHLAEKISQFAQTPPMVNPVVNVPAPVVNVTVPEGRKTKVVERDANNLISRITESFE